MNGNIGLQICGFGLTNVFDPFTKCRQNQRFYMSILLLILICLRNLARLPEIWKKGNSSSIELCQQNVQGSHNAHFTKLYIEYRERKNSRH